MKILQLLLPGIVIYLAIAKQLYFFLPGIIIYLVAVIIESEMNPYEWTQETKSMVGIAFSIIYLSFSFILLLNL